MYPPKYCRCVVKLKKLFQYILVVHREDCWVLNRSTSFVLLFLYPLTTRCSYPMTIKIPVITAVQTVVDRTWTGHADEESFRALAEHEQGSKDEDRKRAY